MMKSGEQCVVVRSSGDVETDWTYMREFMDYTGQTKRVLVQKFEPGRGLIQKGPTFDLWNAWQQGCTCACIGHAGGSKCDACADPDRDDCHRSCDYCLEEIEIAWEMAQEDV